MGVKIILDSVSETGDRITTFHLTDVSVRMLLDFRTHRVLNGFDWQSEAWSVRSSRLSVQQMIDSVRSAPLTPGGWYHAAPKGSSMGRGLMFIDEQAEVFDAAWRDAAESAAELATWMLERNVHPELACALVHPFVRYSCVVTGTDWDGFFAQRAVADDERHGPRRECRLMALEMLAAYQASTSRTVEPGGWHLPFCDDETGDAWALRELSAARCARATLGREGQGEAKLAGWLLTQNPPHLEPFAHVARAVPGRWANYTGWQSERWTLENVK